MITILNEKNQYLLRFDRGEEVVSALRQFCHHERIDGGFFHGLGACSHLKLAYYNLETKKYQEKEFNQDLEIANVTGNVAVMANDLIIHMHGTFSDESMKAVAGHVVAMKAGGTCEIMLTRFEQEINRKLDPETGLKLLV